MKGKQIRLTIGLGALFGLVRAIPSFAQCLKFEGDKIYVNVEACKQENERMTVSLVDPVRCLSRGISEEKWNKLVKTCPEKHSDLDCSHLAIADIFVTRVGRLATVYLADDKIKKFVTNELGQQSGGVIVPLESIPENLRSQGQDDYCNKEKLARDVQRYGKPDPGLSLPTLGNNPDLDHSEEIAARANAKSYSRTQIGRSFDPEKLLGPNTGFDGNAPYGDKGVAVSIESLQGKNEVNYLDIDLHRFLQDVPNPDR